MTACPTPEFIARYRVGNVPDSNAIRVFDAHVRVCPTCRQTLRQQTEQAVPGLAAYILPAPDQSVHLDDAQMLAYAREELDEIEREIVTNHLEQCARCRMDAADIQAFHAAMQTEDFSSVERELARPGWHERWTSAFASAVHAFGVESLHSALAWWNRRTLNARLVVSLVMGIVVGWLLRGHTTGLHDVRTIFLSLLQALATPFIFVAIVHTLMDADVTGRTARRLAYLALSNTLVAVAIGLFVGNVAQPGVGAHLIVAASERVSDPLQNLNGHVPRTLLQPLLDNNILFVVLMAVAFGLALRCVRQEQVKAHQKDYEVIASLLMSAYRSLTIMLNWIVALVPLAVFAVVAELVGTLNRRQFQSLLGFSAAVVFALFLQIAFYLIRLWFRAAMRPQQFLRGAWEAILTAFSTASSAATLPITYTSVRDRVGVRERSAGLGVLVGAHFNRDGTALYEAITPIFIAQAIGRPLDLPHQLTVAVMAIIASIAAPGIPAAGLVTMLLVFQAVGLPTETIPLLLAVDWFLDRCRTAINVMGGMTVTCLLDRRSIPYASDDEAEEAVEPEIVT